MDFKYKTVAEINAMSEDEREKYLADKRTHEYNVRKKELDKAKEDAVEAAKTAAQKVYDDAFKDQPEAISKTDFEKYKTETTAMIENIGKAAGNKTEDVAAVAKAFDSEYQTKMEASKDSKGLLEGKLSIKA